MRRFVETRSLLATFLFLCVVGFIPLLLSASFQDGATDKWFLDPAGKSGAETLFRKSPFLGRTRKSRHILRAFRLMARRATGILMVV